MVNNFSTLDCNISGNFVDGQWIYKSATLFNAVKFTEAKEYVYTINDYLPDDTYIYEVLFGTYGGTGTVADDRLQLYVRDIHGYFSSIGSYLRTRTNSSDTDQMGIIMPMQQINGVLTFNLNVTQVGSAGSGSCGIYLYGYRRLGGIQNVLTISTDPSDATVTFDRGIISGKTCTVMSGSNVRYTVSKEGYQDVTGITTVTNDKTVSVRLSSSPYSPNEVVFESSTAGTTDVEILSDGRYEVYCIGAGGGSFYYHYSGFVQDRGGGSGAGFIGIIRIEEGLISITVGTAGRRLTSAGTDSTIGNLVIAGGGGQAGANNVGKGGTMTLNVIPISNTLNTNGNNGYTNGTGGEAVYKNYGKGCDASEGSAKNGYVKIVYIGE